VPTSEDATARTRLFESIVRLYLAIAERAPLVLFVDDVQWADAATLDLLHYANRRWVEVGAPILLLLALRAETLATNIALAEWYTGMQRDRFPLRLELGPLTIEDTLRLVQALIPERLAADRRPAVEQFSHWLFAEASGQPLYMLETLKALAEQGVLAAQAETGGQWRLDIARMRDPSSLHGLLPPRIREVVRTRLARLSPQAITLLSAGAILGQNLTFGQLWRVANLDEDQALSALDELVRSQLLRRAEIRQRASADPTYAFSHDKIRDVVYTEAGDARRFVFHRRAFEILQAASAAPAILAYHAARAGLMEAAFHYNVVAGDAALQLFAVRDAIMFYELARQGLAESSENGMPEASTSAASWQQLYTQLGRAYELDNQFDNAREIYQALLGLARSLGDLTLEWTALNRLATVATLGSMDLEAALTLLHEAREVAERNDDQAGLAETEWNLAQARFYQAGAWAAALAHGESALARARDLGLAELSARCLNIIARASNGLHAWAAVEAAASEAQAVYAALGDRALEADCLCNVAAARIYRGDTAAGISAGWAARAINLEIGNTWRQVTCAIHLTLGLVDHGALREALEVAEHAVATARTHGIRMLPAVLARLGTVYRTLLDLDAARTAHEEALSLAERMPGQVFVALAAAELCADAALQGAWAEAYQYALRAAATKSHSLAYVGFTGWLEVEALLRGGDSAVANELMRWLSQHARNYPRYQLAHLRCQAVLARWEGRNTQAQEYLLSASALAAELDLPCEQWSIQAALVELYRSSGDELQACAAAAQAAAILQSLVERIDDRQLQAGLLAIIHTIAGN
jgi:predicted ATPase